MVLAATWLDLHADFAWFVVLGNAAAGLWALAAHFVPVLRVKALWIFTAVVEVAIFVQVGLGVATMNLDEIEAPQFHLFYGFVALVTVGQAIRRKGALGGSVDTALDFIPWVGGVKNAAEAVRGRDFIRDRPRG